MNSLGAPIYFRRDSDCPTKNTSATTERIHQGAVNDMAETLYLVFCYFQCFAVRRADIFFPHVVFPWRSVLLVAVGVAVCSPGSRLPPQMSASSQRSPGDFALLVNNNAFDQACVCSVSPSVPRQPLWLWMTVTHLMLFYLFVAHQSAPPALDDSIASKIWFWTTAFRIKALVDEALPVLNDSVFSQWQRLTDLT